MVIELNDTDLKGKERKGKKVRVTKVEFAQERVI